MEAGSDASDENDDTNNYAVAAQSMASLVSISDFCVHHTWGVRTLSPFAIPLDLSKGTAPVEDGMTMFLRTQRVAMAPSDPGSSDRPSDDEGTFVSLFWSHVRGNEKSTEGENSPREKLKRKKPGDPPAADETQASLNNNHEILGQREHDRHLIIDARVQDEQSAQIVLCFPRFCKKNGRGDSGDKIVECFDFCLARGSKKTYEILFGWLETFTGCIVSKAPFTPSAADLARASVIWTTAHWQTNNRSGNSIAQGDMTSEESANANNTTSKPLTLTFAVPSNLGTSGLDTISLNIPPVALMRLCSDMMVSRKSRRSNQCEDGDGLEVERSVEVEEPLPVMEALQSFIQEVFHINIKPFSLIKTSCSIISFGCDGRCKPHCPFFLGEVLQEIQAMTLNRSSHERLRDTASESLAQSDADEP